MASSKIHGITVTFSADFTKFQKELKAANSQIKSAEQEIKVFNSLLKKSPQNVALMNDKLKALEKESSAVAEEAKAIQTRIEKLKETIAKDPLSEEAKAARQEMEQLETSLHANEAIQEQITDEIQHTNKCIEAGTTEIEEQKQEVKSLRERWEEVGKSVKDSNEYFTGEMMKDFGSKISSYGRTLSTMVTAPIVAGAAKAYSAGQDIISSFAHAAALYGDNLTNTSDGVVKTLSQASADLKQAAYDAAKSSHVDYADAIESLQYFALAGLDAKQTADMLAPSLKLVKASGEDMQMVIDGVTDYMTAFNLSSDEAARFTDVLGYTISNTNTNLSYMLEAFKYVAPVATSANTSLEETAAMIGVMANAGIKGSTAGTTLRNVISRLATDTSKSATKLEKYGIVVYDTEGKLRSTSAILSDVAKAWSNMTDEQKQNTAYTVAGMRGMAGFIDLMNSAQEEGTITDMAMSFEDLTTQLQDSSGTLDGMIGTLEELDPGAVAVQDFKSSLERLSEVFTTKLLPKITPIVDKFTDFIDLIVQKDLVEEFALALGGLAAVGPGLLIVGGALSTIGSVLQIVGWAKGIEGAGGLAGALGGAGGTGGLIGTLGLAAGSISAFVGGTGLGLLTNGFEATILKVTGWGDKIRKHMDIGGIKTELSDLDIAMGHYSGKTNEAAWESFKISWDKIRNKVGEVCKGINEDTTTNEGLMLTNTQTTNSAMWDSFKNAWSNMAGTTVQYSNDMVNTTQTSNSTIFDSFKTHWENIKSKVSEVATGINNDVNTKNSLMLANTQSVNSAMYESAKNAWEKTKSSASSAWSGIKSYITDYINQAKTNAVNSASRIKSEVMSSFNSLKNSAKSWGRDMIQNFIDGIQAKWNALKSKISSVAQLVKAILGHTEPKEGAMKGDSQWFAHLGDNLISGLDSKIPAIQRKASEVAMATSAPLLATASATPSSVTLNVNNNLTSNGQNVNARQLYVMFKNQLVADIRRETGLWN